MNDKEVRELAKELEETECPQGLGKCSSSDVQGECYNCQAEELIKRGWHHSPSKPSLSFTLHLPAGCEGCTEFKNNTCETVDECDGYQRLMGAKRQLAADLAAGESLKARIAELEREVETWRSQAKRMLHNHAENQKLANQEILNLHEKVTELEAQLKPVPDEKLEGAILGYLDLTSLVVLANTYRHIEPDEAALHFVAITKDLSALIKNRTGKVAGEIFDAYDSMLDGMGMDADNFKASDWNNIVYLKSRYSPTQEREG